MTVTARLRGRVASGGRSGQCISCPVDVNPADHVRGLPAEPVIAAVTLAELSFGPLVAVTDAERAARQALLRQAEADSIRSPVDAAAARAFGQVTASFRHPGRKGQAAPTTALIAATALANGLSVRTCNPSDFDGIDRLEVVPMPVPDARRPGAVRFTPARSMATPTIRKRAAGGASARVVAGCRDGVEGASIWAMTSTDVDDAIATAHALVAASERVVVLTGAGISTDSGIPDFRGPQGVWTKDPGAERLATLDVYLSEPDVRRRAWESRLRNKAFGAEPNAGHRALVDLERSGRLHTLITQNIDGLHQAAGNSPAKVVEIHGTIHEVTCMSCGWRGPMADTLERVAAGEEDPPCLVCDGILKSATISFGQNLVPRDLSRSQLAAEAADLMLAVGTTLQVFPAAAVVPLAVENGAGLVIVNADPTPFDHVADAVVHASISDALPRIVA